MPEVFEARLQHLPSPEPVIVLVHVREDALARLRQLCRRECDICHVSRLYPCMLQGRIYGVERELHLQLPSREPLLVCCIDYPVALEKSCACIMPVPYPKYIHAITKEEQMNMRNQALNILYHNEY